MRLNAEALLALQSLAKKVDSSPKAMPPTAPHMTALIENVKEVDRLRGIHSQITTKGPGRKHNVEVLHKSAIVLLVACWEAFIEDLAASGLEHMIAKGTDHKVFPASVLERVSSTHAGLRAWDLAGDGWKTALRSNMKAVLAKTTGALNTPKTAQVDELFDASDAHRCCFARPVQRFWYSSGALARIVFFFASVVSRVSHRAVHR